MNVKGNELILVLICKVVVSLMSVIFTLMRWELSEEVFLENLKFYWLGLRHTVTEPTKLIYDSYNSVRNYHDKMSYERVRIFW